MKKKLLLITLAVLIGSTEGSIYGQCINAGSDSTYTLLGAVLDPMYAYDKSDGDLSTYATITISAIGTTTLIINFNQPADQGDSIIILFGVPVANITDWGSHAKVTFTPYSAPAETGVPSDAVSFSTISFFITLGANALSRIAIPITSRHGAQSVSIIYSSLGPAVSKPVYIYDVAVRPGPVMAVSTQLACRPWPAGSSVPITLLATRYNVLFQQPVTVVWYDSDGTTELFENPARSGDTVNAVFTTSITVPKTFYVRNRWERCSILSEAIPINVGFRQPVISSIELSCSSPPFLLAAVNGTTGTVTYDWTATDGGTITSETSTAVPRISGAGTYSVVVTDVNGCQGSSAKTVTEGDCAVLALFPTSFTAVQDDPSVGSDIVLYPNPVSHILTLKAPRPETIRAVRLVNLSGQEILTTAYTGSISVGGLASGIYLVQILYKDGHTVTRKLVKL